MASVRADALKRKPKNELVTILDDLDFSWYQSEIEYAAHLYNQGTPIDTMAAILRPTDKIEDANTEIALLIIDMARKDVITPRKSGIFGEVNQ